MEQGYIKLYRRMLEHPVWLAGAFSEGQAFVDLLLRANYAAGRVKVGREFVTIKRGCLMVSVRGLAERWGWSKNRVSGFLSSLEADGMLSREKRPRFSLICMSNYDEYQSDWTPQEGARDTAGTEEDTNNKNKNNKKDIYGVLLSHEEKEDLKARFGDAVTARCIEKLGAYKKSTGRAYRSDYYAILDWVAERVGAAERKNTAGQAGAGGREKGGEGGAGPGRGSSGSSGSGMGAGLERNGAGLGRGVSGSGLSGQGRSYRMADIKRKILRDCGELEE